MVDGRAWLFVALLALAGCSSHAGAPEGRAPAELRSAVFASLPAGWHQRDEGVQRRGRCRAVTYTLATSWRTDPSAPRGWAAGMPPDAIAISVGLSGPPASEGSRRADYPPIGATPLRLPRSTSDFLEGAPDVPEYRAFGRTADYLVEVRADVNSPTPSRALLADARSVVERLRLPDWPELCP